MRALLCVLFLIITVPAGAKKQPGPPPKLDSFTHWMDTLGLTFRMPRSLLETPVRDTLGIEYAFGMMARPGSRIDYEIRYCIWPLAAAVAAFDSCKQAPGCVMENPNTRYRERALQLIATMTGGKGAELSDYKPEKTRTAADRYEIANANFRLSTNFTFSYLYGHLRVLHKDNVADIVIMELGNNPQLYTELRLYAWDALTFKN